VSEIAFVLGIAPDIVRALIDRLEQHRLVRREGEHADLADEVTRQVLRAVMGADRVRSIRSTLGQVPDGTSLAASADAG
jgi:hypothetical protein